MEKNQRARTHFFIVIGCVALIVHSLLLAGCEEKVKPGATEVKRQTVTGVEVAEARLSQVDEYYETSGTVKARATAAVASRVMGTVTALKVREGDRVREGQVLLTIDDRDVAQRVNAAEKAVEAAKQNKSLMEITYQRYRKLHDEKALSPQEMDQIATQKKVADVEYERAIAGLSEAKVQHGFTMVAAPFSGLVTEKKIEAGGMAVPGIPLLTLEDTSSFTLEANVDQGLSTKISIGTKAEVAVDPLFSRIEGRISEVVPAIDPMSRTFLVKIGLSGTGLRSGLYGKVRIPVGKKEAILVPRTALLERGHLTGIYTVNEKGIISFRLVRVGKEYGDNIEVLSGLNAGERIIIGGVEKAVEGGVITSPSSGEEPPSAPGR